LHWQRPVVGTGTMPIVLTHSFVPNAMWQPVTSSMNCHMHDTNAGKAYA